MYIWPLRRPAQFRVATAPEQQPPSHPLDADMKMDKEKVYTEKGYLPRPVLVPAIAHPYGKKRIRRRTLAVFVIFLILFWNFQPVLRLLNKSRPLPLACTLVEPAITFVDGLDDGYSFYDDPCDPSKRWYSGTDGTWTLNRHELSFFQPSAQDVDTSSKELVPLEAHIMSKCPDAQDCLVDMIIPTMQLVSDKVNFTLSFIGDVDKDETVHCKHGEDECLGNMMMLCAAKLYPDPKINLGFSTCLIRDYEQIPTRQLVESCALEHAVNFDKLNKCVSEEGEGLDMLKDSIKRSADKDVQYSCTVRLNDKLRCIRDSGEWVDCDGGSEVDDLVRDINALYK